MIPGAPPQARWQTPAPRRALPPALLERLVQTAFPGCHVQAAHLFPDGLRNANFKVDIGRPSPIVLRIYEHDPSLCQKEIDLQRLVAAHVPVPALLHAEPHGMNEAPPFAIFEHTPGITFRDLKRRGDVRAIAQAARSVGEALAAIGRTVFPRPGWLGPGPTVGPPLMEGDDPIPRFVDACLASPALQARVAPELRSRLHALMWSHAERLASAGGEARLVHGDFNRRNVLVRASGGRWAVVAVLDWELAVSGSPLQDVANFLRYERAGQPVAEPHFSAGYRDAGGTLPDDWRSVAVWLDLTSLCESLTHEDLPGDVVVELVELASRALVP